VAIHSFDPVTFRALFPAFASETAYPTVALQMRWDMAVEYISAYDSCRLSGTSRQLALNLLTAHLTQIYAMLLLDPSATVSIITGASIDKISVSMQAPSAAAGSWKYWLSTTQYGLELWALLSVKSAGGFFVGGSSERSAIRKSGGRF
jgi:hypothetical protein